MAADHSQLTSRHYLERRGIVGALGVAFRREKSGLFGDRRPQGMGLPHLGLSFVGALTSAVEQVDRGLACSRRERRRRALLKRQGEKAKALHRRRMALSSNGRNWPFSVSPSVWRVAMMVRLDVIIFPSPGCQARRAIVR